MFADLCLDDWARRACRGVVRYWGERFVGKVQVAIKKSVEY